LDAGWPARWWWRRWRRHFRRASAPQGYAGYNGYAYSPGYVARSWGYPAGYDTSGMAYSYRDLGWRPDGTLCYPTLRAQNRC